MRKQINALSLTVALSIAVVPIHAQDATDFKGVELNSPLSALSNIVPLPYCVSTPGGPFGDLNCIFSGPRSCVLLPKNTTPIQAQDCKTKLARFHEIAGTNAKSIAFHYYEDRLGIISLTLHRQSPHRIVAALTAKFGEASEITSNILQSGGGATFDSKTHQWNRPDGTVTFNEYASKLTESSLTYRTDWAISEFTKRRQAESLKDADKL